MALEIDDDQMLASADDINLRGSDSNPVEKNTDALLKA